MKTKDERPRQPQNDRVLFESEPVASSTECTGLMAFAPETEEETAALGDIYDIPLPVETTAENKRITEKGDQIGR